MINRNEIWECSQHENDHKSSDKVNQYDVSVPGREKCEEKKRSWGQEADRATDLSQMCIFETTGEHDFNIWEEFCAIMWPL